MKMPYKFTVVFEEAAEGGYIGFIKEFPGVNTQGETIEETKGNLLKALQLTLFDFKTDAEKFISESEGRTFTEDLEFA
jgi:predicted RNase H-like HicB family nuclease